MSVICLSVLTGLCLILTEEEAATPSPGLTGGLEGARVGGLGAAGPLSPCESLQAPGPGLCGSFPPPLPERVCLSESMKLIFPLHMAAGSPILTDAPRLSEGEGEGVQQEGWLWGWEPQASLAHLPHPVLQVPPLGYERLR